jgi:uncharacterized protein
MRHRLLLIVAGTLLLSGCTHLVFQPMRQHVLDPAQIKLKAEDQWIKTSDKVTLHAWWLPHQGKELGTILLLHGNAENISTHIGSVWWLPQYGYNVLLFDYRGYGRSEGEPSLNGIHLDMAAALDSLFQRKDIDTNHIVVLGQSMGGATAITGLASSPYKERVASLIVEGTFTSYRSLTRELLEKSWLTWLFQWPLSLTIDDTFRPIDSIREIQNIPILIIHSRDDEVIPFHHGEELYKAAIGEKQFWALDKVRHIAAFTEEANRQHLLAYLKEILH